MSGEDERKDESGLSSQQLASVQVLIDKQFAGYGETYGVSVDTMLTARRNSIIESRVDSRLRGYAVMLGVVNLTALLGAVAYIFFFLPDKVAGMAVARMDTAKVIIDSLATTASNQLADVSKQTVGLDSDFRAHRTKLKLEIESLERLQHDLADLDEEIRRAQKNVNIVNDADIKKVSIVLQELKNYKKQVDVEIKISEIRGELESRKRFGACAWAYIDTKAAKFDASNTPGISSIERKSDRQFRIYFEHRFLGSNYVSLISSTGEFAGFSRNTPTSIDVFYDGPQEIWVAFFGDQITVDPEALSPSDTNGDQI